MFYDQEPVEIGGRTFGFSEIISRLRPYLTEARWERMQAVVDKRTSQIVPVLEDIYDRGNISAVMRSAEAFGFYDFRIIEGASEKFKAANRVTQGADKWLRVQRFRSVEAGLSLLKERGYQIFATHLQASRPIDEIDFSRPTAIIFGNEKNGVSEDALNWSDGGVILPMYGFSQSFNISVAAALSFYHIFKDRQGRGVSAKPNESESQMLLANYLLRSIDRAALVLGQAK